jgi:hypothetical protein
MTPIINTIQTAVGQLGLTYKADGELDVTIDGKPLAIPQAWTKQTSKTIARKVCQMIKMGQLKNLNQYGDDV